MFHSVVPFWVRQLCRQVLRADATGTLDPACYGVERVCQAHAPRALYVNAIAVLGTILGMVLLASSLYMSY
jgi:hypothetical protein